MNKEIMWIIASAFFAFLTIVFFLLGVFDYMPTYYSTTLMLICSLIQWILYAFQRLSNTDLEIRNLKYEIGTLEIRINTLSEYQKLNDIIIEEIIKSLKITTNAINDIKNNLKEEK